jgi:hypothetical protein
MASLNVFMGHSFRGWVMRVESTSYPIGMTRLFTAEVA